MAVLTVIQNTYAVVAFRQIRPSVRHCLEFRLIPARIPVIRTSHITVLYIISAVGRPDIHRECSLQELMLIVEIHFRLKVDPSAIAVEDHILPDTGLRTRRKLPFHMNLHAERTHLCNFKYCKIRDLTHLLLIKDIDIPCVKIKRLILEYLQHIRALSLGNHLTGIRLVIKSRELSMFI